MEVGRGRGEVRGNVVVLPAAAVGEHRFFFWLIGKGTT